MSITHRAGILEKRELRGSLKELKHLQKLNCGYISCYSRSVEIVQESKIFQLCSTFMDTSDDNFDLNDFLGIGVDLLKIAFTFGRSEQTS